jgi:transcriptional regulator with XRE-family HTH domain
MNVNKLKAKIVENDLTQDEVAKRMGISVQSLNAKLNKRTILTLDEVVSLVKILNITDPIPIFFENLIPQMQQ